MSFLVQCDGCKTSATVEDASDPDSAVKCDCCPEDHHHGQAAEGATPCRPITITALAGTAALVQET